MPPPLMRIYHRHKSITVHYYYSTITVYTAEKKANKTTDITF